MKHIKIIVLFWNEYQFLSIGHIKGRKEKRRSYTSHLYAVKNILKEAGVHAEYILDAALLHDILEDTNFTKEYLAFRFGKKIADLVSVVSKLSIGIHRTVEWKVILITWNIHGKIHPEAIVIKMADRLHNLKPYMGFVTKKERIHWQTENFLIPLFKNFYKKSILEY